MRRWLAILAFLVVPSLAHAEGRLLMIPPTTPVPVPPLGTPVTDTWQRAHEIQAEADIRASLVQWEQRKAFDSARACEAELTRVKDNQTAALQSGSGSKAPLGSIEADMARRRQVVLIAAMERWDHARCLPASLVPVR